MSDAASTIGAAGVTTVGTLAVTGMALNAINRTTGNMNRGMRRGGTRTKRKSTHRVFSGTKHYKGKSMLGF